MEEEEEKIGQSISEWVDEEESKQNPQQMDVFGVILWVKKKLDEKEEKEENGGSILDFKMIGS